jgi:two-component system, OmpR family, sensor kinase
MTHAGQQHTGFWRSVRRLPDRTPLRVKLISALLALVAIALLVISVAGISFLNSYLLSEQDQTLTSAAGQVGNIANRYLVGLSAGFDQTNPRVVGVSADWVSNGKIYHVIVPTTPYNQAISPPSYSPGSSWLESGGPVTVGAQSGGARWRVVASDFPVLTSHGPVDGTLVVGIQVTSVYQTLGNLTRIDVIVSLVLLVALFVIGVAVVRSSLRPLKEIEQTAGAIAAGDLTRRVPERDPRTEVGRLGRSLNIMLGQIETAFRQRSESARQARRSEERMRQFVTDASHELRTPLTAIRGFAEYYRQRGGVVSGEDAADELDQPDVTAAADPSGIDSGTGSHSATNGNGHLQPADLDRIMRRVEQESARMGILVEDMLLLARLDQQRPLEHRPVDLLTLAADAVHDARVVAPNRSINLTVSSDAAPILIGDEVRLRQVIGNLMSNALTHTPDGTPIEVRLRSGTLRLPARGGFTAVGTAPQVVQAPAAVLEVADAGPGLTAEQAEHAFERFYRADQARSTGGTGLGLAIVAALVAAHRGTVWVDSQPGKGATFGFALPLAPEAIEDAADEADLRDVTDDPEITDDAEITEGRQVTDDGDLTSAPDRADAPARTEPGAPTTRPPGP